VSKLSVETSPCATLVWLPAKKTFLLEKGYGAPRCCGGHRSAGRSVVLTAIKGWVDLGKWT